MKLILVLLLFSPFLLAQSLDFYKEDITFKIDGTEFNVDGIYYFRNHTTRELRNLIYFPLSPACPHDGMDSVKIFDLIDMRPINLIRKAKHGFHFPLEVQALDSAVYRIKYRQAICSDSVRYILKSTLKWGKLLKAATFKLLVPDTLKIKYFSYLPDTTYRFDEFSVYLWQKKDFLPDKDMIFKFERE